MENLEHEPGGISVENFDKLTQKLWQTAKPLPDAVDVPVGQLVHAEVRQAVAHFAEGFRPVDDETWRRFGLYAFLLRVRVPERLAWLVARRWPGRLLPRARRK